MNMREKIARAILKARFYDPEPHMYESLDDFNAGIYPEHWDEALVEADAALDALMEPTEGMIKAVEDDYYMGEKGCPTCGGGRPAFTALIRAAKEGK